MTAKAKRILHQLLTQLNADTYAKMCNDRADKDELEALKNKLYSELRVKQSDSQPSRALAISFAKACTLQDHYKRSVGERHEILSTIHLATLFEFKVSENHKVEEALNTFLPQFGLSEHDRSIIDRSAQHSIKLLNQRRSVVDWLRSLVIDTEGNLDKLKVFQLFSQLFPDHPLQPDQVDLITTRTGLYWLIPKSPTSEEQIAWVKYYDRFSFNRFIHFPMFSGFEIRDSNKQFIESAMQALAINFHDTIEVLNSVISMQKREEVEKYIIHDTWGHIWQADLTGFRDLYDEMESLRRPIEASKSIVYPCGNVVCLADLYFPNKDQTIEIHEEEADTFIKAWIDVHTTSSLAPLMAEMTADIVEYKFVLDNPTLEEKMPSSSVFKNDPAKFDFAWVDFSYFSRELKKIHREHFNSPTYQESFNQRLVILLKDRYKNRLISWSEEQLLEQVKQATQKLLEKFKLVQNEELSNKVEYIEKENYFFSKLDSLLMIQATVNHFIDHELSTQNGQQEGHFELLVLFMGIAFCDWRENPDNMNFSVWAQQFCEQFSNLMEYMIQPSH